jgi:hypothetical protein
MEPDRHLIVYTSTLLKQTHNLVVPAFKLVAYYKYYKENGLEEDKPFELLKESLLEIYGSLE